MVDIVDGRFYASPDRWRSYAWMRANEPVHFDAEHEVWGVASYEAVREVERSPDRFSSAGGIRPDGIPMPMMIEMDNPAHTLRRQLVSKGFTPKRVAATEAGMLDIVTELIDAVCERGECDFVADLAALLPMAVIGGMLGVERELWPDLLQWSDDMVCSQSGNADQAILMKAFEASMAYRSYALGVIAQRRQQATEDLISILTHAAVDGQRLDDDELIMESLLILIGGDETTRHVISGGVEQLLRNRSQWQLLQSSPELVPQAVEEMIRWVSPIKNMCRTATDDLDFRGAQIKKGQKLLLLYESANRDETHFDAPDVFDVRRERNDHLAFGLGTHFCLGANLARLEIKVMVEQLLLRVPDLELASDAALPLRAANFVSGAETMPVVFSPSRRGAA